MLHPKLYSDSFSKWTQYFFSWPSNFHSQTAIGCMWYCIAIQNNCLLPSLLLHQVYKSLAYQFKLWNVYAINHMCKIQTYLAHMSSGLENTKQAFPHNEMVLNRLKRLYKVSNTVPTHRCSQLSNKYVVHEKLITNSLKSLQCQIWYREIDKFAAGRH